MTAAVLDTSMAASLSDARLQAHHAAQFATAAGISYLPPEADDSQTNLEWLPELGALASHVIPGPSPFRIAVRVSDLTLLALSGHPEGSEGPHPLPRRTSTFICVIHHR